MANKKMVGIFLKALLAGWVTIVFGTSILIYIVTGNKKQYHSNNILNALRNIWEIADEMGPAVKISIVILFAILLFIAKWILNNRLFYFVGICCAITSVLLVLAFLPENLSRGYGIGLTGVRFDSKFFPFYFIGGVFGGIVYCLTFNELLKKSKI